MIYKIIEGAKGRHSGHKQARRNLGRSGRWMHLPNARAIALESYGKLQKWDDERTWHKGSPCCLTCTMKEHKQLQQGADPALVMREKNYQRLRIGRRDTDKAEWVWEYAHRLVCWLWHGESFKGRSSHVRHLCSNPTGRCINPLHVRFSSQRDNNIDAVELREGRRRYNWV